MKNIYPDIKLFKRIIKKNIDKFINNVDCANGTDSANDANDTTDNILNDFLDNYVFRVLDPWFLPSLIEEQ